ncbi:hypothetical protein ISN44_As06g040670 [Arabidopsis suecica]|uniref:Uncharacterized protein n=1 Tax=Arabidopsis suecica TaxID=45249 RepID=A0A8T2CP20_ARASU|nr:hypothetical protein ISN44_As06g040670 [Arabidopsis suecica]
MDNKSATKAEAAPSVIKDTTPKDDLEKDKKNITTEKKISDAMEILEGFGVRLHQMEEKLDLLISLIRSNNEVKIGSVKAEAESMSVDGSSSDEEPYSRFGASGFGRGGGRGLFVGGRFAGGRCGGQGLCRRYC